MAQVHVARMPVVQSLKDSLSALERRELYRKAEQFPLPSDALLPGSITIPGALPELAQDPTDPSSTDADNSVRLYESLKSLDEVQASDERLWVWFTHVPYFRYSQTRWDTPENEADVSKTIRLFREHFFLHGSGLAALRRNSVSRLWWAAHLTHAPWQTRPEFEALKQPDPFCYTRVLFSNQDIYQGLIERSFGTNSAVLIASLEVFRSDKARQTSQFATDFLKELNLISRYRELSVLGLEQLLLELEEVALRLKPLAA
ncbi:hypothetical protein D7Y23_33275 [Corallococcus sp. AB050B]|nr:hypothetical protein D7Y23_33275 [Corallococcus sp. AB050B]